MEQVKREIFILRTKDLEKAMEEIYSDTNREFLENFHSIQSIEDLKKLYNEHPEFYIFRGLPVWTLRDYNISGNTEKILLTFGQRLNTLEDKENKKRKKLREQIPEFKNLIGFSTAEFSDKFWGPNNELWKWLEKNGNKPYCYYQD